MKSNGLNQLLLLVLLASVSAKRSGIISKRMISLKPSAREVLSQLSNPAVKSSDSKSAVKSSDSNIPVTANGNWSF
jgi:hypothetical protein